MQICALSRAAKAGLVVCLFALTVRPSTIQGQVPYPDIGLTTYSAPTSSAPTSDFGTVVITSSFGSQYTVTVLSVPEPCGLGLLLVAGLLATRSVRKT